MTTSGLLSDREELEALFEELASELQRLGVTADVVMVDDCDIVFQRDALVVRAPPPEVVFVMKLYRADPQDREDMVMLWRMCDFDTAEDAVAAFENAYPHAPEDEYLVDYVRDIARHAATA